MLLFRSERHVERWNAQLNRPRGGILSLAQGWELAQAWYGDRLNPDWAPKSAAEAESVFAKIGLEGDFWTFS